MRMSYENLIVHAKKAIQVYKNEIGAVKKAFWVINPRDFHYLKSELDHEKYFAGDAPNLAGIRAVIAHQWRKPPIIAININELDFVDADGFEPDD